MKRAQVLLFRPFFPLLGALLYSKRLALLYVGPCCLTITPYRCRIVSFGQVRTSGDNNVTELSDCFRNESRDIIQEADDFHLAGFATMSYNE